MQTASNSPLIVALIEFTEPMEHRVYLPYASGLLQSYAQAQSPEPGQYVFLPPVFRREAIQKLVLQLASAQVVGFSTYIWNAQRNLALAKALKANNPDIVTIFGGPQIPDQAEAFLRQNPQVDLCVHGEGEIPFAALLESIKNNRSRDWSEIAGVSYLDQDEFHYCPPAPRLKDLDQIPSPFLQGYFEPILLANPELTFVSVWETNRGCPFSCTFCDWGSAIASKVNRFGMDRLKAEIEWFGRHKLDLIYCTDANFGILPRDLEIAQALATSKQHYHYPQKVIIQLTKNQSERAFEAVLALKSANLNLPATLSMQSVTPGVMKAIKRDNISLEAYRHLMKRFLEHDIPTYTDMLVGLPGETFESFLVGIEAVMEQGQHREQRFWNTYLLPNAEMSQPSYRETYGLETIVTAYLDPYMPPQVLLDGVQEQIEMVVASKTMSREDWVKMRALAWLTQILYYGRLLQLPLLLIREFAGLQHRDILRAFLLDPLPQDTPVLNYLREFLFQRAREIIGGQPEFLLSKDPASGQEVWLPTQAFAISELVHSPRLPQFYAECQRLLETLLAKQNKRLPPNLLNQSLHLVLLLFQHNLRQNKATQVRLSYNLWTCYQNLFKSQAAQLQAGNWLLTQSPDKKGGFDIHEKRLTV